MRYSALESLTNSVVTNILVKAFCFAKVLQTLLKVSLDDQSVSRLKIGVLLPYASWRCSLHVRVSAAEVVS